MNVNISQKDRKKILAALKKEMTGLTDLCEDCSAIAQEAGKASLYKEMVKDFIGEVDFYLPYYISPFFYRSISDCSSHDRQEKQSAREELQHIMDNIDEELWQVLDYDSTLLGWQRTVQRQG